MKTSLLRLLIKQTKAKLVKQLLRHPTFSQNNSRQKFKIEKLASQLRSLESELLLRLPHDVSVEKNDLEVLNDAK